MRRLPDWPERLISAVRAAEGRPFSWGSVDCAHFAADCCLAITGHDPIAPWRGGYDSEFGWRRLMVEHGFADPAAWADAVIGPRGTVSAARRGDWVLAPYDEPPVLGVCCGAQAAFLMADGLTWRGTLSCAACWPIG